MGPLPRFEIKCDHMIFWSYFSMLTDCYRPKIVWYLNLFKRLFLCLVLTQLSGLKRQFLIIACYLQKIEIQCGNSSKIWWLIIFKPSVIFNESLLVSTPLETNASTFFVIYYVFLAICWLRTDHGWIIFDERYDLVLGAFTNEPKRLSSRVKKIINFSWWPIYRFPGPNEHSS